MPDSKRLESSATSEAADRDSRAEALLVDGLDRYFGGQHEEAIHLWTRVLFLDRSHARARAYIDRARTALAERQRRGDEMLHQTSELLAGGHTDAARALFTRAEAATGDDEQAAAVRLRLERAERLERARSLVTAPAPAVVDAVPVRTSRLPAVSRGRVIGALVAVALVAAVSNSAVIEEWLGVGTATQGLPVVARAPALPVLTSSEAALIRARTLYGRGRLAEALQALDRVAPDSVERASSDQLRVEIQQILLASRRGSSFNVDASRGRP